MTSFSAIWLLVMPLAIRRRTSSSRSVNSVKSGCSSLLSLRQVDPMYRACFADGTELRVRHGRDAMTDEIERVCADLLETMRVSIARAGRKVFARPTK